MRYAVAAVLLVLAVLSCREPEAEVEPSVLPDQVIEGFVMHESSSGERLYTLNADTAFVFEAEGLVRVVLPRVTFYDESEETHAVLLADHGTIHSNTSDLVAHGSVLVQTADSTFLRTDSLAWNNNTRLVRTDALVDIQTPKGRVTGQGLLSDAGLNRIEILSEVEGTMEYQFDR